MISILMRVATVAFGGLLVTIGVAGDSISEKARKLHFSSIVVDTHDDTTQLMLDPTFDLGARQPKGGIDIPRMREGGLGAIFLFHLDPKQSYRSGRSAKSSSAD